MAESKQLRDAEGAVFGALDDSLSVRPDDFPLTVVLPNQACLRGMELVQTLRSSVSALSPATLDQPRFLFFINLHDNLISEMRALRVFGGDAQSLVDALDLFRTKPAKEGGISALGLIGPDWIMSLVSADLGKDTQMTIAGPSALVATVLGCRSTASGELTETEHRQSKERGSRAAKRSVRKKKPHKP